MKQIFKSRDKYFGISKRITRWKEPSEFEEALASLSGFNHDVKAAYSLYYKQLDEEYWNKGRIYAHSLLLDNVLNFKAMDFDEIYDDMVYCLHRYGLSFQDYCIYNLMDKSEQSRGEFVADKMRYHYCDILNSPDVYQLMTDKYLCYSQYKKFFKREICPLFNLDDTQTALRFIAKHQQVIFKPLREHSGHGIKKLSEDDPDLKDIIVALAENNPGILEELIIQGEEMNLINAGSINSCRVVTFTIGSDVIIIGATLRMGIGDSITDNAGAGGIFASIDVDSGVIKTDAKNYNNSHYIFHPTSGTKIIGFQMPNWNDAKDLIRKMALHHPGTTLISWDIAYSVKGWCMIEANDNGDWSLIQSNSEKGLKDRLYSLMDRYFDHTIRSSNDYVLR